MYLVPSLLRPSGPLVETMESDTPFFIFALARVLC